MKLSEAIMLNGMTKPQGVGPRSVKSTDAPCAIGGALQVVGKQDTYSPYKTFELEWPWVARPVDCPRCEMEAYTVTQAIFHLNDHHLWTRQQIAEWVQSIEPKEEATKPTYSNPPYWCCKADFGQHEPDCKNAEVVHELP